MKFHKNKQTGKLKPKATVKPPRHKGYRVGDRIVIKFGITKCQFITPFPSQMNKALSAPVPGYVFTPQYKAGYWDGQHHFLTRAGYFPTGLLPVVIHVLKTGKNPLIETGKKGHTVLSKPADNVSISVPKKCKEFYHPGLETYYVDAENLLDTLNSATGVFAFPIQLLKTWKEVRKDNLSARPTLNLAKALREQYLLGEGTK
jgi:hypothetical protein